MWKTAFFKDILLSISRSKARFFSILIIIAIGVGFFAGINATESDMVQSADKYYKDTNLSDFRIQSPLGFRESDIDSVMELNDINIVQEGFSKDLFLTSADGKTSTIRLYSYDEEDYQGNEGLNQPVLQEGKLPEKPGEIVVEIGDNASSKGIIGSKVTLTVPEDEEIYDSLITETYEIVGIIKSPMYINFERGQTNIGDGSISFFAYVHEESFEMERVTDLFVLTEQTKQLTSYTEEYEEHLIPIKKELEDTGLVAMSEETRELQLELDDGEAELEENMARVEQELTNADQALLQSEQEIENMETLLNSNGIETTPELEAAKAEIKEGWVTFYEEKAAAMEKIESAKEDIEEAEANLAAIPDEWFVNTREANPGYSGYGDDAERIGAVAKVFPLFFFLVAALVCLTTMTRMVEEERVQIGTFKALGYGTLTIASKYLFYALASSLIGALVGLSIGFWLFPTVIMNAYGIMYSIPDRLTPYHLDYAIISIVIALITTVVAALFATLQELRSTPANLMQPRAPKPGKRILIERITPLWKRLSFSRKVTYRNLFRYKRRFWMTILGISGCTALLITGFGLSDSVNVIGKQFDNIFIYDGQIVIDAEENESGNDLTSKLEENKEIASFMPVYNESIEANLANSDRTYEANLMIVEDTSGINNFITLQERESKNKIDIPTDGAVITEKLAKLLQIEVGDVLNYSDTDNKRYEIEVAAITENYLAHHIYFSPEYAEQVMTNIPEYNGSLFNLTNQGMMDESAFKEELMANRGIIGVILNEAISENYDDTMKSLDYVVFVLIIAAAALAFVVLYNLTNINITERIREIATIKVLGFREKEVDTYINRENIILTILGTVVGLVLGSILHQYVIRTMEIDTMMFGREVDVDSYIWSIALTISFSILVNFFMHFKLKHVNMVESLKSVD